MFSKTTQKNQYHPHQQQENGACRRFSCRNELAKIVVVTLACCLLGARAQDTVNTEVGDDTNLRGAVRNLSSSSTSSSSPSLPTTPYDGDIPHIVWLLSYPNSGTTFTHQMYESLTDGSAATNYGNEARLDDENREIRPLHGDKPEGPYLHFSSKDMTVQKYVLTKTHCGGYCIWCSPDGYTEHGSAFIESCARGFKVNDPLTLQGETVVYDHARVYKAVHVIRDPLDNMVARFHYQRRFLDAEGEKAYPKSAEGFRSWCNKLNDRDENYRRSWPDHPIFTKIDPDIPCRSELFRYIQWHNNAFEVTYVKNLPVLIIPYDRYNTDIEGVASDLRDFLEIEGEGIELPKYHSGKNYHSYFSDSQIIAVRESIRRMATAETWGYVSKYFDGTQPE